MGNGDRFKAYFITYNQYFIFFHSVGVMTVSRKVLKRRRLSYLIIPQYVCLFAHERKLLGNRAFRFNDNVSEPQFGLTKNILKTLEH